MFQHVLSRVEQGKRIKDGLLDGWTFLLSFTDRLETHFIVAGISFALMWDLLMDVDTV